MLYAIILGFLVWFSLRVVLTGFYTIDQNERALITNFGRVQRVGVLTTATDPVSDSLSEEEKERYNFPQVRVIQPGGPYFKFPWQKVHKVSIATQTVSIGYDPENPHANNSGEVLEAVTKDQLNTGIRGQLQFRISERNLYAFLFGIKNPVAHVMGYLISILRERIANFEAPERKEGAEVSLSSSARGVSINDLRKNLSVLNQVMQRESISSVARYGMLLEVTLIIGIDPPNDVESALAAINTAHNVVSSEISLAQASADQKIVQSRKAVEIETLRAQAEVQLLEQLANQLQVLKTASKGSLKEYLRNVRLPLFSVAKRIVVETKQV